MKTNPAAVRGGPPYRCCAKLQEKPFLCQKGKAVLSVPGLCKEPGRTETKAAMETCKNR